MFFPDDAVRVAALFEKSSVRRSFRQLAVSDKGKPGRDMESNLVRRMSTDPNKLF